MRLRLSKYSGRVRIGIWPLSEKVCTRLISEDVVSITILVHAHVFPNAEWSDGVTIARKLGMLPLALDQAGSYINSMHIPFSKYLLLFESTFAVVTAKRPPTVVWQYRDETVFTTWEVSFTALGRAAQELFLLFGFFDNESIPEELLPLERLNDGFRIGEFYPVTGLMLYSNSRPFRLS